MLSLHHIVTDIFALALLNVRKWFVNICRGLITFHIIETERSHRNVATMEICSQV